MHKETWTLISLRRFKLRGASKKYKDFKQRKKEAGFLQTLAMSSTRSRQM